MCKLFLLLLIPTLLKAADFPYEPWMTSPLLVLKAETPENPTAEPYVIGFSTYGEYNDRWSFNTIDPIWSISTFVDIEIPFSERLGIELFPSFTSNFQNGKNYTNFQDTALLFGYQLLKDEKGTAIPDLRFFVEAVLPSGNFEQFDPNEAEIQQTGRGAYRIGPAIAYRKILYFEDTFLVLRFSLEYLFFQNAEVRGFNTYGGGFGTEGKIRPGQTAIAFFSFEYGFNQNWVLCNDTIVLYRQEGSAFKGTPGVTENNLPATVNQPTIIEISITPGIEYNFSERAGILWGAWITLAGRNTDAFASVYFAFNYAF